LVFLFSLIALHEVGVEFAQTGVLLAWSGRLLEDVEGVLDLLDLLLFLLEVLGHLGEAVAGGGVLDLPLHGGDQGCAFVLTREGVFLESVHG